MTETPEDCVRRGAAYLDEHRPGWEKRVDLDTLDMSSPRHCVLGQAYAEEGAALGMTGFDYVVERARSRPRVASFGFDGWGADLLEAAWSAEIIKRRR
ncbi:MAG: hypothetical protein ACRD1P_04510 [Thermoanaerobaculia bacterium]